jgi:outer membrane protein TolC
MYRIKNILITIYIIICIPSFAKELPPLSLLDAIAEGLENNYSILLAHNSAQVSSNNATMGNAGMLPSVNMNGTVNKGIADSRATYLGGTVQER